MTGAGNMGARAALAAVGGALMWLGAATPADAQPSMAYEYAVKVVCGKMDRGNRVPVAAGTYSTAVNIHNPNRTILTRRKVAMAGRGSAGPISAFETKVLEYDQAMYVDCEMMQRQAGGVEWLDGFLVIQSSHLIDVVAVYTTGRDDVTAFHTERVPNRRIP